MQNHESIANREKSILITGCSSGIGKSTALYLAQKGFTVFATVRKGADSENLKHLDEPNLIPISPLDLTNVEQIANTLSVVKKELKQRSQTGLFALINNAGGSSIAPIELLNLTRFETEIRTRVIGSVAMVQTFLPMIRQATGRILWIMTPAIIPTPYVTSIHACDFAVNNIVRTLNIELKSWNIPNIMIRCGGIRTPAGLRTTQEVEDLFQNAGTDRLSLYKETLQKWNNDMADFDKKRTEPQKVAEVIYKALVSHKPKMKYSVGYMSKAAAFLELLPQTVTDRILKKRF